MSPGEPATPSKRRGRPRKPDDQKKSPVTAWLPPKLHDAVSRRSLRDAISISALLAKGLELLLAGELAFRDSK